MSSAGEFFFFYLQSVEGVLLHKISCQNFLITWHATKTKPLRYTVSL